MFTSKALDHGTTIQSLLEGIISWCKPKFSLHVLSSLLSRAIPKKVLKVQANIVHMGFHVEFSSTSNVIGYDSKLSSWKPKQGSMTLSTNENSRVLKSHGLMSLV